MAESDRVIDYAGQFRDVHSLTLREDEAGAFRVIFPVTPTWVWVFGIVLPLIVSLMKLAAAVMAVVILWDIYSLGRNAALTMNGFQDIIWHYGPEIIATTGLAVGFWIGVAVFNWRRFRRFAGEPRVLIVNREGIIDRRPGWLQMRERHIESAKIKNVRLKVYRVHFDWKRSVADLIVETKKGWTIRFRLSSTDATLPLEISRCIATTIGCPLK
jgi:hypothetical protein